mgnify:CR=1 FL=1
MNRLANEKNTIKTVWKGKFEVTNKHAIELQYNAKQQRFIHIGSRLPSLHISFIYHFQK